MSGIQNNTNNNKSSSSSGYQKSIAQTNQQMLLPLKAKNNASHQSSSGQQKEEEVNVKMQGKISGSQKISRQSVNNSQSLNTGNLSNSNQVGNLFLLKYSNNNTSLQTVGLQSDHSSSNQNLNLVGPQDIGFTRALNEEIKIQKNSSYPPKNSQSQDKNISNVYAKTYRYWIDIMDLQKMLSFSLTQLQNAPINKQEAALWDPDSSHHSQSIIIQNIENPQDELNRNFISQFTQQDSEIRIILSRFLTSINLQLSQRGKPQINLFEVVGLPGVKKLYLVENAKVITQVFKSKTRDDLEYGLRTMIKQFSLYQQKYANKTLRLCFSTQQELYTIIGKIITSELLNSNQTIRKLCAEIYQTCLNFREQDQQKSITLMNAYFYIKLELFSLGRSMFDPSKKDFPLHKAVFEQNLPLISRLVKGQCDGVFHVEKNEIDTCGHTPLTLAVKLGHIDTIKVLCDLFCCPKLKSMPNFPCALDVASSIKNKEIIKLLLEANQKIKQHYLELHKEAMFKALESLPDFKIDMNFQMQSNFIPFLGSIAPNDTYKIYKQGSKLRLDMTLVGFKNLKSIRGNLSVLFKGRGQQNEGELYVVDHDTKSVSNIFNQVVGAKLDKDLEDIMSDQQYQKQFKADKFQLEPQYEGRSGETVMSRVFEGFRAEKYKMRTTFTMTRYKLNMTEVQSLQKFKSFDEYLQSGNFNDLNQVDDGGLSEKYESERNTLFSSTTPNPFLARVGSNSQDRSNNNPNLPTITDYHGSSNNLNTLMGGAGPQPSTARKTTKKTINASIWLCNQHPLSLDSFLPLLQVLSFSSKQIAKFKDYLTKYQLPAGSFPLRAKIPIFFTMKAAFSLQNLSLDPRDLPQSLFSIDEQYLNLKRSPQLQPETAPAANLKDLYNLIRKTNNTNQGNNNNNNNSHEDDEEDEDLESIQRANELFNSMLKKGSQVEELLLVHQRDEEEGEECSERSPKLKQSEYKSQEQTKTEQNEVAHLVSFHSELDSFDISEKQMHDESFKLATHAFSQIQTMKQINKRHDETNSQEQEIYKPKVILRQKIQLVIHKSGRNQPAGLKSGMKVGGTTGGENLFDSRTPEEKHLINTMSTKKLITKMQKPPLIAQPITPSGSISILSQSGRQSINTTQRKSFLGQNKQSVKNYKNLIKYQKPKQSPYAAEELKQSDLSLMRVQQQNSASSIGGISLATGVNQSNSQGALQRSTADNSLMTQKVLRKEDSSTSTQNAAAIGHNWFKQIIDYKNAILGKKDPREPGYLQTIESEEIVQTEICQIEQGTQKPKINHGSNATPSKLSKSNQPGISSNRNNNSSIVSHLNFEDLTSRRSQIGSIPNQNLGQVFDNQSILSSNLSSRDIPFQGSHLSGDGNSRKSIKDNNQPDKRQLINHKNLITKFHDYVITNMETTKRMPGGSLNSLKFSNKTPNISLYGEGNSQKDINNHKGSESPNLQKSENVNQSNENHKLEAGGSFVSGNDQIAQDFLIFSSSNRNQQLINSKNQSSLVEPEYKSNGMLPPKIGHRRQSSHGGSGSKLVNSNINDSHNNQNSSAAFPKSIQTLFNESANSQISGIVLNKSSNAPLQKQIKLKQMPPSSSQFKQAQEFLLSSAAYNQVQHSRQDAQQQFMIHAHSHNIPKKVSTLDSSIGKTQAKVIQPFSTLYGDGNSSTDGIRLDQQQTYKNLSAVAVSKFSGQTNLGLLGAPTSSISTSKRNTLGSHHQYNHIAPPLLTESGSNHSLVQIGGGSRQQIKMINSMQTITLTKGMSKKTSDADITLSYQV